MGGGRQRGQTGAGGEEGRSAGNVWCSVDTQALADDLHCALMAAACTVPTLTGPHSPPQPHRSRCPAVEYRHNAVVSALPHSSIPAIPTLVIVLISSSCS